MERWTLILIVIVILAGLVTGRADANTFDTFNEGWSVVTFDGLTANQTNTFSAIYHSTGGNPGGYISINDPDQNTTFFSAPSYYFNHMLAAYGSLVEFDAKDRGGEANYGSEMILKGAGQVLFYNAGLDPASTWTHFQIPLWSTSEWHLDTYDGATPTPEQMQGVFSSLEGMYLFADWVVYADDSGLDNFTVVPEPTTMALFGLGGLVVALRRKK